ncbi:MAG TPA: DUF5985 family protein [Acetobacteraceae bacterium]|nr:DUF5985 family protein [Acetobacteraceae bacterium]
MNDPVVNTYFSGMITAGFLACGLFFAKFWWRSRDALFLAFAAAFWLLAANTAVVVLIPEPEHSRSSFYLLRVVAFVLIAVAIIRKNASEPGDD